jgi:uncharacterized protein (TIGR03382 family)
MRTFLPLLVLAATLMACAESHPVAEPSLESRPAALRPDAVTLLRDIVARDSEGFAPEPRMLAATRQYVFFSAEGSFDELWRTDGTAAGTLLLRDFNVSGNPAITGLMAFKDRVFFAVDDGASNNELWTSDGTREGTRMVKDLSPGPLGAYLENFTVTPGALYFTLRPYSPGDAPIELWKTDGTEPGTLRVFRYGQPDMPQSGSLYTAFGPDLYFRGFTSAHGTQLWRTDGTAAGTQRVVDDTGAGLALPTDLTPAEGMLYLFAGGTVYRTDGTPAGTRRLLTRTGGSPNRLGELTALGSRAVFIAHEPVNGDAVWLTDGTPEGTQFIKDVEPGEALTSMNRFIECGPYVFFNALVRGPSHELWRTDGTSAGTLRLGTLADNLMTQACAGGRLFFLNYANPGPNQLAMSNGTVAGTGALRDFKGAPYTGVPSRFAPWGDSLAFVMHGGPGSQVWRSNGTVSGTVEIPATYPRVPWGARVEAWLEVDGKLLFSAIEWVGSTVESYLWLTDGTPAGTSRLEQRLESPAYNLGRPLVKAGPRVFFIGETGAHGAELWATDGTDDGTYEVKNIGPGHFSGFTRHFTARNDVLYFQANDGTAGAELWRSDGTEAGTYLLADLYPGTSSSEPEQLVSLDGFVYFTATSPSGTGLWRTDGTPEGTTRAVTTGAGAAGTFPEDLLVFGGRLYFTAHDGVSGRELWRLDSGGPVRVSDIVAGSGSSYPANFMATSEALYFTATHGALGDELYRVVGDTVELVADILPGALGSSPKPLVASGRVLYFAATDTWRGRELWRTDGTPEGTFLVKDINPGPESTFTRNGYPGDALTLPDGSVLFAAVHGAEGRELWRTDGSEAGTVAALTLWPGPESGAPVLLGELGGRVLLQMTDPVTGSEVRAFPWALLDDRTPPGLEGCPDVTVEATSALGAVVSYTVSTRDDSAGTVTIASPWPSGSVFPLGSTEFEVIATDLAGNTARCEARVQVRDTTAPTVQCPASFSVKAAGSSGATPAWTLPSAMDAVGMPTVTATPEPGSLLPVGASEVTVTAMDAAGNAASCRFTITVTAESPDAGAPDAGAPDAGAPDAGMEMDAGTPPPGGTEDASQGCGCASGTGALSLLAWGALGLLLRRRH